MLEMRKEKRWFFAVALCALLCIVLALNAYAGDPTGAETLQNDPGAPVDYVWVLLCAFLVMFMQPGFALVEAGFCRAKNAINLMMKNLMDFVAGSLAFFAIGYALMMGKDWHLLIGTSGWFLHGEAYDVHTSLIWIFQVVFAATAATIVSGAVAERIKFSVYLFYSAVVSALVYPIYGHWVWGGGWLSKLPFGAGALDFAGSGIVHAMGGFIGLAGAMTLGPRIGRYDDQGRARPIVGHNIPMAALGVFILWFGWFGFNAGSTLSAHELRISVIAVNTNLAAAAGALAALLFMKLKVGNWDLGMTLNGALAGLVAVTAPCAWIASWAAVVIGLVAGVLVCLSVHSLDKLHIDDPVGAVSVHGINGIWGIISVGLFADGTYGNYTTKAPFVKGLFYGGGAGQLVAQLISAGVCIAWAFLMGWITFRIAKLLFGGIRVSAEEEAEGLDYGEHGGNAYPDFSISPYLQR
jgi:Amt family ammonium transporter